MVRLAGHTGLVRGVAYDPAGKFVASAGHDGLVKVWDVETWAEVHSVECGAAVVPSSSSDTPKPFRAQWDPRQGEHLALPGSTDIRVVKRETWETAFTLEGGHEQAVTLTAWSPDGAFLASVDAGATPQSACTVAVWDTAAHTVVRTYKSGAMVNAVAWSPSGTDLAVIDAEGQFKVCEGATSAPPAAMEAVEAEEAEEVEEAEAKAEDVVVEAVEAVEAEKEAAVEEEAEIVATATESTEEAAVVKEAAEATAEPMDVETATEAAAEKETTTTEAAAEEEVDPFADAEVDPFADDFAMNDALFAQMDAAGAGKAEAEKTATPAEDVAVEDVAVEAAPMDEVEQADTADTADDKADDKADEVADPETSLVDNEAAVETAQPSAKKGKKLKKRKRLKKLNDGGDSESDLADSNDEDLVEDDKEGDAEETKTGAAGVVEEEEDEFEGGDKGDNSLTAIKNMHQLVGQDQGPTLNDDSEVEDGGAGGGADDAVSGATYESLLARLQEEERTKVQLQPAFVPGSTPQTGKRSYLVWNMVGSIVCRDEQSHNMIEVEFSDTTRRRTLRMTDHYGFKLGNLSESGVILATHATSEGGAAKKGDRSIIFCRPLRSAWSDGDASGDWMLTLPAGEEAVSLAVGDTWAACCTDRRFLRLFKLTSGLEAPPVVLPGPAVAMSAHGSLLVVAYHSATPFAGSQSLSYQLLAVREDGLGCHTLATGPLPLSSSSSSEGEDAASVGLRWLGISDQGLVVAVDSLGLVSALRTEASSEEEAATAAHSWMPILDTRQLVRNNGRSESYWPIAMTGKTLMAVLCKGPTGKQFPATMPKPIITALDLQVPLVSVVKDLEAGKKGKARAGGRGALRGNAAAEASYLSGRVLADQKRWRLAEPTLGSITTDEGDELFNDDPDAERHLMQAQIQLDKCLLKQMQTACTEGDLARAVDLIARLQLPKSYEIANRVARSLRHDALGDHILTSLADLERRAEVRQAAADRYAPAPPVMAVADVSRVEDAAAPSRSPKRLKKGSAGAAESETKKSKFWRREQKEPKEQKEQRRRGGEDGEAGDEDDARHANDAEAEPAQAEQAESDGEEKDSGADDDDDAREAEAMETTEAAETAGEAAEKGEGAGGDEGEDEDEEDLSDAPASDAEVGEAVTPTGSKQEMAESNAPTKRRKRDGEGKDDAQTALFAKPKAKGAKKGSKADDAKKTGAKKRSKQASQAKDKKEKRSKTRKRAAEDEAPAEDEKAKQQNPFAKKTMQSPLRKAASSANRRRSASGGAFAGRKVDEASPSAKKSRPKLSRDSSFVQQSRECEL